MRASSPEPHLASSLDDVLDEVLVDDAHLLLSLKLVLIPLVHVVCSYLWISIIRRQPGMSILILLIDQHFLSSSKNYRILITNRSVFMTKRLLDINLYLELFSTVLVVLK